jgi:adenylate cyclase
LRRVAAFGAILGVGGALLSLAPATLELEENLGLKFLFAIRGPVPVPSDVVVVGISRDSAEAVGQTEDLDDWPRSRHASLIKGLADAGVAVIAFDVMFKEPRDDDHELAAAIESAGNVLLVEHIETNPVPPTGAAAGFVDRRMPPVAELKAAALGTVPFTLPKVPIRVSQFWTFGRGGGDTPSLPVAALQAFLLPSYDRFTALLHDSRPALLDDVPASQVEIAATRDLGAAMRKIRVEFQRDAALAPALRVGLRRQPADPLSDMLGHLIDVYDGGESRYLNFYGPPRTIRTVPYDLASTSAATLGLAGEVVFVGFSEPRQPEQEDDFISVFSQTSGANLSGVEIAATAFANLIDGRSLIPPSMPIHLLLVVLWGLLLGGFAMVSSRSALALAALAAAGYGAAAYWAFVRLSVWLPILVPLVIQIPAAAVIAVVLNYRQLFRQRERVQAALGYYVPRGVVTRLAEESVTAAASRQLLHGTCLFTDAQEYTTVSEAMRPEDLAALMNDYYRVMFSVVERHGGMVSNTSGDSMVAVWATASPDASARTRACRAALEIVDAVADFNRRRGEQQLPTRVGLESGEMLLGNIGAEQRFEYRAIGDIVNTASRLQGLNRLLGTRVLLSEATAAEVPQLVTRDLGTFLLLGKKTPVRVYEPLGFRAAREEDRLLARSFAAALAQFEKQRWAAAQSAFADLLLRFPADGPSAFYVGLSAEYLSRPRPWSGAVAVGAK